MERKTVKQLKKAAKDLGLRRYLRLRKHELIAAMRGQPKGFHFSTSLFRSLQYQS
ncbi:hypothetical protein DPMN_159036 [Dreissena polymorpha]|uniref:Rho termination factor-like N-terminal domain-containing protein n=1 Tax=Dreissena polymorpha TaxID=45954 RepID=A0A9D4EK10_DREPO|nr:hypothetical protein DPMN_159036 [Dreissena polymorpha]